MAAGGKREGAGRKSGIPNKATTQAREAIASFVEGNVDRLTGWLDQIAEKDPDAAFKALMSVVEYHIPKLQRTTISGDADNPLVLKDQRDAAIKAVLALKDNK